MEIKDRICPCCEQELKLEDKVSVGGDLFTGDFAFCIPRDLDGSPVLRISDHGNFKYIAIETIQYLLSNKKYVDTYVEGRAEPYLIEMSLCRFAKYYPQFLPLSRSILVRKDLIEEPHIKRSLTEPHSYWVRLKTGMSMPVSRRYWRRSFSRNRNGQRSIQTIMYGMVALEPEKSYAND